MFNIGSLAGVYTALSVANLTILALWQALVTDEIVSRLASALVVEELKEMSTALLNVWLAVESEGALMMDTAVRLVEMEKANVALAVLVEEIPDCASFLASLHALAMTVALVSLIEWASLAVELASRIV